MSEVNKKLLNENKELKLTVRLLKSQIHELHRKTHNLEYLLTKQKLTSKK